MYVITDTEANSVYVYRSLEAKRDGASPLILAQADDDDSSIVHLHVFASDDDEAPAFKLARKLTDKNALTEAEAFAAVFGSAPELPRVIRGAGNFYFMLDGAFLSGPINEDGSLSWTETVDVDPWFTSPECPESEGGPECRAALAELRKLLPSVPTYAELRRMVLDAEAICAFDLTGTEAHSTDEAIKRRGQRMAKRLRG